MAEYIIRGTYKKALMFYDEFERIVDGIKVKAFREESNDYAKIAIIFPDSTELPDKDENLMLNDFEYDFISIDGDLEYFWDIPTDMDEEKKAELMEELEEYDNSEGEWTRVDDRNITILEGGYTIVEKV